MNFFGKCRFFCINYCQYWRFKLMAFGICTAPAYLIISNCKSNLPIYGRNRITHSISNLFQVKTLWCEAKLQYCILFRYNGKKKLWDSDQYQSTSSMTWIFGLSGCSGGQYSGLKHCFWSIFAYLHCTIYHCNCWLIAQVKCLWLMWPLSMMLISWSHWKLNVEVSKLFSKIITTCSRVSIVWSAIGEPKTLLFCWSFISILNTMW